MKGTFWYDARGRLRLVWELAVFGFISVASLLVITMLGSSLLSLTPALAWARTLRVPLEYVWSAVAMVVATAVTISTHDRVPAGAAYVDADRPSWRVDSLVRASAIGALVILVPAAILVVARLSHFEASTAEDSPLLVAWGAAALFVPAAITEELMFRGFAFSAIRQSLGAGWAIGLTSVLFGLAHARNPGSSVTAIVAVMAAGVFLATLREAPGGIPAAIVAHVALNYSQSVLLHAPVSGIPLQYPRYRLVDEGPAWLTGGSWGPEGGMVAMAAMLLTTFLLQKSVLKRTEHG